MVHGRSGCGGDRQIARGWIVLAATICQRVMGLELGAAEVAVADSRCSVSGFQIVKSYDYFFARRATEEAWRFWSRSPVESAVGVRFAEVRSDPDPPALDLDLDPGPAVVALGPSGAIRASLSAFAKSLEGTAAVSAVVAESRQRPLLNTEADFRLPVDLGSSALMSLSDPVQVTDIQGRFAGLDLLLPDDESAAVPPAAAGTATASMGGAAMPTPRRIVATALESVAILACGRRTFRRWVPATAPGLGAGRKSQLDPRQRLCPSARYDLIVLRNAPNPTRSDPTLPTLPTRPARRASHAKPEVRSFVPSPDVRRPRHPCRRCPRIGMGDLGPGPG